MTANTAGSALWNGQAHMPTVRERRYVVTRGEGAYIETDDGLRLLDATAGLWHANIGHGRAELADVAAEQMRRLETYHVFGRFANDVALELADRLAGLSPIPDAKVILTSGGSDSIDAACKLARRHWQEEGRPDKRVILSRVHAYHGLHAYGTSIAGIEANREGMGSASLVPETARIPENNIDGVARTILEIGADRIAAIVAEPVIGTGGVLPPAPGYLEGLRRLADEHDILLILDEVITGFGRMGTMFASEHYGVGPDLVTFAKGVTSGYAPLGGVLVSPRLWERYWAPGGPTLRHGLTYSGHATASAVALENLRILEDEGLVARAGGLAQVLAREIATLDDHSLVVETRAAGFLAGVQVRADLDGDALMRAAIDRGVVLRPLIGPTLQISPPFVVTDDEVRHIVATVREVLDAHDA